MSLCSAAHAAPRDVASACRFIIFDAEGFKWFEVAPGGGAGKLRGEVKWMQVRGAARVGEWDDMFGVEISHPGVKGDVTILWCATQLQRDDVVTAINSRIYATGADARSAAVNYPQALMCITKGWLKERRRRGRGDDSKNL